MRKAVCPGSFDPPTLGHLDIIVRAAGLFDHLTVAVLVNEGKSGLFTAQERMDMLSTALAGRTNITVETFSGLLADFCRVRDIDAIVKGLRVGADFEYELAMAQMNSHLAGVESIFLPTAPQWSFVASSLVKEVARLGGDVAGLVPDGVIDRIGRRLAERGRVE